MGENDTPESIQVIRLFLREVECYDMKWFASIGGYSAYAQLRNVELLVERLGRQNGHLSRAAEQRNEAVSAGQICPSCAGRGYTQNYLGLRYRCMECDGTGQI